MNANYLCHSGIIQYFNPLLNNEQNKTKQHTSSKQFTEEVSTVFLPQTRYF